MKSLYLSAIALVVSSSAMAQVPSGYAGVAAVSASTNAVANTGSTASGGALNYQASGAWSNNTTSASAQRVSVPNGVQLNTSTSSVGSTETYAHGIGQGTSDALALQGGVGVAGASQRVGDSDYHHGHSGFFGYNSDTTYASGSGYVTSASLSAQGSAAASKVTNGGYSYQRSGAGAYNDTSAYLTVNPDAHHNHAKVGLTTGAETKGLTYAYSRGNVSGNGTGGAIAGGIQGGKGEAVGSGYVSVKQNVDWYYHTPIAYGSGNTSLDSVAQGGTLSVSGGTQNHGGLTAAGNFAKNDSTSFVGNNAHGTGMVQTLSATSESKAGTGGFELGNSRSWFKSNAEGDADASGSFGGAVSSD